MKPCLADLNFLLPVVVRTHPHHASALKWYLDQPAAGIGMCRVVQLGMIRLLGNSYIMQDKALPARADWDLTSELLKDERVEFWAEPPGLDNCVHCFATLYPPLLWLEMPILQHLRSPEEWL